MKKIILVSIDSLRADCVGGPCLSEELSAPSGHVNALLAGIAGRGAFFSHAITAAPYTSAAHAAYLTGKFPRRNGVVEVFNSALRAETLFSLAKRHGMTTALKTDFPLILGAELGFTKDVDHYLVEDDEAFLDRVKASDAFVGLAHFSGAHYPYGFHRLAFGAAEYRQEVAELERRHVQGDSSAVDTIDETFRSGEDRELLLRYKRIIQVLYQSGQYRELFHLYQRGLERFLRTRFVRWFERLREAAGSDALIVLFGDHGEQWDARSYGHHNSMHEGVLRVPIVLIGGGITPTTVPTRIRTVDVLPTLAELQGWNLAADADGISLLPILSGTERGHRSALAQACNCEPDDFSRCQQELLQQGVRRPLRHLLTGEACYEGEFKLVRYHNVYQQGTHAISRAPQIVQYRLSNGVPREVASTPRAAEMIQELDRYNSVATPNPTVAASDEVRRYLQENGYRV